MEYRVLRLVRVLILTLAAITSMSASAKGVSLYLPLQTSPEFELQVEKLATVTAMPVLTRPYHIATVYQYAQLAKDDYPKLYHRIMAYMERYREDAAITHKSIELAASNADDKSLPNQRGRTTDSVVLVQGAGYYRYDENLQFSFGNGIYDGGGLTPQQTFVAYGNEYMQLDVGYREHWYSPFQENSLLMSTQAETPLTLTLSNSQPLTSWNIRYDVFVGLLDEMEGIRYGDEVFSGEPGILGTHLSVQLTDWWTIGGNRTMQFGGGKRSVSLGDIWDAFWDPAGSDNCGSAGLPNCDADQEVGNQLASVVSKMDLNWFDMPFTFYWEYGGEDTKDHSYSFGNGAQSYSFFFPFLTEDSSFLIEYQDFHSSWYVHHLYEEGYSNKGNKMGHWWGDEKAFDDGTPATIWTARYNLDFFDLSHVSITYRTVDNEWTERYDYERSHEIQMRYSTVYRKALVGAELYAGQDVYGDDFYRLAVFYRW